MTKIIVVTPIQKRFGDIDVFRHVGNVRQQEYLDLGKTDFCRRVVGLDSLAEGPTLMMVATQSDFVGQLRYEDEAVVRTWVERIGTKSVTLRQQIVCLGVDGGTTDGSAGGSSGGSADGERVCTVSTSVLVAFDRARQQTLEIPAEWRAAMVND